MQAFISCSAPPSRDWIQVSNHYWGQSVSDKLNCESSYGQNLLPSPGLNSRGIELKIELLLLVESAQS
eukprot:3092974-Amphidinium_carterae.1